MRVLLVDDHAVVRHGLRELLTGAGVEVVGALDDGSLAEAAVRDLEPDLVLMDLSMPGMDGIEATRAVLTARPETKVVILTSFAEHARLHAALEAGAVGYLLKDAEPDDILARAPRRRCRSVCRSARGRPRPCCRGTGRRRTRPLTSLTPRERDVLALVATGLPNKSIARRLEISEKTVKAHLTRVFSVVGVSDRTSAALWAQRHGLA